MIETFGKGQGSSAAAQYTFGGPPGFKSLTGAVASALQHDLVTGRYLPGEKLPIVRLAKDYGVSPGAVREALSRLVSENLVEFHEQRGFRAAPVSLTALLDITRTRILIDAHALRDSIRLGDVAWEGQVLAIQHQLANCPGRDENNPSRMRDAWQHLHRLFHRTLISACGSDYLLRFHDQLFDQTLRYRSIAVAYELDQSGQRDAVVEHAAVVDAVLARDPDAAAAAIERHYMSTAKILAGASEFAAARQPAAKSA